MHLRKQLRKSNGRGAPRLRLAIALAALPALCALVMESQATPVALCHVPRVLAQAASAMTLETVLEAMDRSAASFHSAQADFVWDQYEAVVKETTTQKGAMYIRKAGANLEMAADVSDPPDQRKYVLYSGDKAQVFMPGINQVTTYTAGKNKDTLESFLVLGFGGRGHDLNQQFEVAFAGTEKIAGVETGKLQLTPKSSRVRGMFEHILLWIDPARGVSIQQRFEEPASGNYRLAKYSNIRINPPKLPEKMFSLKGRTNGATKYVNP